MSKNPQATKEEAEFAKPLLVPIKRRSFFMYAGATAGATALLLSGCDDDDNNGSSDPAMVNVGSGDVGVLNYAYALEQLEAAFYTKLRDGAYYKGLPATSAEKQILDDLYYHEVIHREFFKAAITAAPATPIKDLTPDFSTINFDNKASVLGTAKAFEDLGVAAYNGAGKYITTPLYLVIAGKIVSVEARHAALIRDLVTEGSFVDSDVVSIATASIEISKEPSAVAMTANTYLATGSKLDVSGIK
ncbi:ferritin-like domain-containing protein [Hymenobacter sp. GOD-10R]|uniref:ferritin-like domain-containing protein n=1 Tax=Hymenobacter sp. GOD-10R TaxID=3093922 RepID=UPI002D772774|nr:ferritin-like domain-containing protein [Hymenobacter sp. GOD-10R]WRQ29547.1 ferritin-like domain-containing protein [Hymenobacter sp. GOD-10R]